MSIKQWNELNEMKIQWKINNIDDYYWMIPDIVNYWYSGRLLLIVIECQWVIIIIIDC